MIILALIPILAVAIAIPLVNTLRWNESKRRVKEARLKCRATFDWNDRETFELELYRHNMKKKPRILLWEDE